MPPARPTVSNVVYDHQIFGQQQWGGVSRYFCEIATRVHRASGGVKVVAPLHFNDYLAGSDVPRLGCYVRRRVPRSGVFYRAVNALLSPMLIAGCKPDLVHRTYYAAGRPRHAKLVVTVHDMIHELYPQHFATTDRTRDLKLASVEAADRVICVSQRTAEDLMRMLRVPAAKISVTHLGYSEAFSRVSSGPLDSTPGARPYLLYVGHRSRHKNFERALRAYASSARLRSDFDLVAFGGVPFERQERALLETLGLRLESVRRLTGSDDDLAVAYRAAHALIYPSEYEGFGLPPLEAMSCGCPVICSNASSIPEVVADAGEYFDPLEVESIRRAVEQVCYGDARRRDLAQRGLRRCYDFSWDRCAAETLEIYKRTLAGGSA